MGAPEATRIPLRTQYRREYACWKNMLTRCRNPKASAYARYGGRGITVCDRWKVFVAFLEDMGASPSPNHLLERIDNDGPYEPGNCCWATRTEQQANTKATLFLTYLEITLTLAEWSRIYNIPAEVIRKRLHALKWSIPRALRTPHIQRTRRTQPSHQPGETPERNSSKE
jgi:hypothetical protein